MLQYKQRERLYAKKVGLLMTYRSDYVFLICLFLRFRPKKTTRQVKALDSHRFLVSFRINRNSICRICSLLHSTTLSLCKSRKDLTRDLVLCPQSVALISFMIHVHCLRCFTAFLALLLQLTALLIDAFLRKALGIGIEVCFKARFAHLVSFIQIGWDFVPCLPYFAFTGNQ